MLIALLGLRGGAPQLRGTTKLYYNHYFEVYISLENGPVTVVASKSFLYFYAMGLVSVRFFFLGFSFWGVTYTRAPGRHRRASH